MKVVLFCHSLLSDWNHGNAHFLRGICSELSVRGHDVTVYEPVDAWSAENLIAEAGAWRLNEVKSHYPLLRIERYDPLNIDLDQATSDAHLVIVHEWNTPELIAMLGQQRRRSSHFRLLFHDTHHRTSSDPAAIFAMDLAAYDGVLAFGEAVRERYVAAGWGQRAWTWHEAADTRVFKPLLDVEPDTDLVFIGNWGDEERSRELSEFLFEPVKELGLSATAHGVRYPQAGLEALARAGIEFWGWLPNYRVPESFARHRVTLHIPRRPYVQALPGIPTIRIFEALAAGIPLISAHFEDTEGLFRSDDFIKVTSGTAMCQALRRVIDDRDEAREFTARGLETILTRHTCAHRVSELLALCAQIGTRGLGLDGALQGRRTEARAWD